MMMSVSSVRDSQSITLVTHLSEQHLQNVSAAQNMNILRLPSLGCDPRCALSKELEIGAIAEVQGEVVGSYQYVCTGVPCHSKMP